eukprot:gene30134-42972_t
MDGGKGPPLTLKDAASRIPFPGCHQDKLEVPVFNMKKEQVGTRANSMWMMTQYEQARRMGFGGWMRFQRSEVPGSPTQVVELLRADAALMDRFGDFMGVSTHGTPLVHEVGGWGGVAVTAPAPEPGEI